MKTLQKIFLLTLIAICSVQTTKADNPTYSLSAKNFTQINSNTLEFDIYIKHTNPGLSTLSLLHAQYFFKFNPAYATGGALSYQFVPNSSELPVNSRPRNPVVSGDELRLACNAMQSGSMAPVISSNDNGTRITRMKLQTTANSFSGNLNLRWKNASDKGFYTSLSAFSNGSFVKITDSSSNVIQTSSPGNMNIKLAIEGLYNNVTNSANLRDTVRAYLRNINSPYTIVDSSLAVVDSVSLTGNFVFSNAASGTYYVVIKHRNSLETWSKSGGESFISGSSVSYDFTSSITQAYESNMIQLDNSPVTFGIYSGETNDDGTIDVADNIAIYNDALNFTSGYVVTDLTGDDFVDASDLIIAYNNSVNFVGLIRP